MPNNSRSFDDPNFNTGLLGSQRELHIFAAIYQGYAIAIPKNPDFLATIGLIREAYPALASIATSQIRLLSRFDHFGDLLVELRQNVWGTVLPSVKVIEVAITPDARGRDVCRPTEIVEEDTATLRSTGTISVHVIGGPADLKVSIPEVSTIRQLKNIIFENDSTIPRSLGFSNQGVDLVDDDKLPHEYGIVDQSIISIASNIQVYVTSPERSKVPMRITLYANVTSLKLLVNAKLGIPVYKQVLICAGEELDDATQLGSYHQIVHDCQVFVDKLQTTQVEQSQLSLLYPIRVQPEWAAAFDDEDGDTHMVFATSTVLDLKTLVANLNMIVPSRQALQYGGQLLEDSLTLGHYQVKPGDVVVMKVSGQTT